MRQQCLEPLQAISVQAHPVVSRSVWIIGNAGKRPLTLAERPQFAIGTAGDDR
jgi:hypothetical protein